MPFILFILFIIKFNNESFVENLFENSSNFLKTKLNNSN